MTASLATSGFSSAAEYVSDQASKGWNRLQESSAFGIKSTLLEELASVWEDCRNPNWDGYNALPVTQDVLRNTYVFLESMPLGSPRPTIGAEPDGDLTLEWHRSARRTLSVSVNALGDLQYSALFGPSRVYGTEAFFGDVPDTILKLIRRVYAA
jgi:hypothetical protein